ncbi:ADA regulatory protein [Salmonella enterica subsp. enterica]|uniref:ADA regulatory protein n=1 Tax=Salmonella enterica I TaxID=59201 RepID=A0A447TZK6_SALET|nr:ADA regulatory protein [Salmonella enterica subsp. enterica]
MAESERGICAILPGDSDDALLAELHTLFPSARHEPADALFQQRVRQVVAAINTRDVLLSLPLDIQGTAFQQQVWQALCAIPCGETVSYQQLAADYRQTHGGTRGRQRVRRE